MQCDGRTSTKATPGVPAREPWLGNLLTSSLLGVSQSHVAQKEQCLCQHFGHLDIFLTFPYEVCSPRSCLDYSSIKLPAKDRALSVLRKGIIEG